MDNVNAVSNYFRRKHKSLAGCIESENSRKMYENLIAARSGPASEEVADESKSAKIPARSNRI